MTVATLLASILALGIGVWISKPGGQIRHPEFRTGSASSAKPAGHEHGASEPAHEKMHPPDTSGVHKHETAPRQPETPLPDSLEGTWKAIHEHHGLLESAVSAKKFREVQSHAEHATALAKRLVELTHRDHKPAVESGVNKISRSLDELKASAETGSELVMKNSFQEFEKRLTELEQQMKKQ